MLSVIANSRSSVDAMFVLEFCLFFIAFLFSERFGIYVQFVTLYLLEGVPLLDVRRRSW